MTANDGKPDSQARGRHDRHDAFNVHELRTSSQSGSRVPIAAVLVSLGLGYKFGLPRRQLTGVLDVAFLPESAFLFRVLRPLHRKGRQSSAVHSFPIRKRDNSCGGSKNC